MDEQLANRLDRFERRLDDVAKTLETLARVEERQFMQTETLSRLWKSVEALEKRVDDIESNTASKPITVILWGALVVSGGIIGFLTNIILRI
jgi:uncharacterized protein Yka (UPF0111/DUF47 family)